MSLDLRAGTEALLAMSDGSTRYTILIEETPEKTFLVRIEDGWYNEYARDGKSIVAGVVRSSNGEETPQRGLDIVEIRWLRPGESAGQGFWKSICR